MAQPLKLWGFSARNARLWLQWILSSVLVLTFRQNELFYVLYILFILVKIMLSSPEQTLIDWQLWPTVWENLLSWGRKQSASSFFTKFETFMIADLIIHVQTGMNFNAGNERNNLQAIARLISVLFSMSSLLFQFEKDNVELKWNQRLNWPSATLHREVSLFSPWFKWP